MEFEGSNGWPNRGDRRTILFIFRGIKVKPRFEEIFLYQVVK